MSSAETENTDKKEVVPTKQLLTTGFVLLGLSVLLVVFFPCPSNSQYTLFRLMLALAAAGIGAIIPGFIKVNYKKLISAGGALGLFVIVYLVNPATTMSGDSCDEPLDLTIFLKPPSDRMEIKLAGTLQISINNEEKEEKLDEKKSGTFRNIPAALVGKEINIHLNAKGWQFDNQSKDTKAVLDKTKRIDLNVIPDNLLCCIKGSVRDQNGMPLKDARIIVSNISVTSNENGWFELEIPSQKQKKEQVLTIIKEGFELWEENVFPELNEEVKAIMFEKK